MGKYCVFSHKGFGGGISLITTADNADRVSEIGLTAADTRVEVTWPPPFSETDIPGKGIGLVANRTIQRGEQIMAHRPAVMMHKDALRDIPEGEQARVLELAVQKLPAGRRRGFKRQMGQSVVDIFLTNSFQVDIGGPEGHGHHLGDFPEVARLNHDCRPKSVLTSPSVFCKTLTPLTHSLAFYIDANLAHHTHAVRDIVPGEELTISYVDSMATHAERQARLQQSLGFACGCSQCRLSAQLVAQSDANVVRIAQLEAELGDLTSRSVSLAMVKELVMLYETEQLEARMSGALTLAALNCAMLGDENKAREYAERTVDAVSWEFGG